LEEVEHAIMVVNEACKPSPPSFITKQLMRCDYACKSRNEGAEDQKLRTAIFAEELQEFPADILAEAFQMWIRSETFTPSVSDIRENCWKEYRARYGLKTMLEKMRRDLAPKPDLGEFFKRSNCVNDGWAAE